MIKVCWHTVSDPHCSKNGACIILDIFMFLMTYFLMSGIQQMSHPTKFALNFDQFIFVNGSSDLDRHCLKALSWLYLNQT